MFYDATDPSYLQLLTHFHTGGYKIIKLFSIVDILRFSFTCIGLNSFDCSYQIHTLCRRISQTPSTLRSQHYRRRMERVPLEAVEELVER